MSILEQIYEHRRSIVAAQKETPSQRLPDLQAAYDLNLAPPLVDFVERVRQSPFKLSLMAEIKRASPSKGVISLDTCAPARARTYALAGASVISVLTEPKWFKGTIDDLRSVRQALIGIPNRPALLRKDFIFDEYQILEARLAGADTVLLIVKMLNLETLTRLYEYSQCLKMEPLVEVNTVDEMKIAIKLGKMKQAELGCSATADMATGAKVIGVNNRNLISFEVDVETTIRLMNSVPKETMLCALSGITGPQDIKPYLGNGVGAVLVGEALMRAKETAKFIAELLGDEEGAADPDALRCPLLVKICGTRSAEAAATAVKHGADLIGIILVTGTKRCVSTEVALQISKAVHDVPKLHPSTPWTASAAESKKKASSFFEYRVKHYLQHPQRALLVGVFRNQPLNYVLEQQRLLNLDLVQLHGSEAVEWASLIPCPVIRSFNPDDPELGTRGYHSIALLDSGAGGTGQPIGTEKVVKELDKDNELRIMLAGGLTPDNVIEVVKALGDRKKQVVGVDVSSGLETEGKQDLKKIERFIIAAKSIQLDS